MTKGANRRPNDTSAVPQLAGRRRVKTWARDHAPANDNTTGGRRRWYVLGKRLLLAGLLAAALLGLPAVLLLDRP